MDKILMLSIMSVIFMIFLAGCAKSTGTTAPNVSSQNVEASSAATETVSGNFVNDATPTSDQTVPDLT